jgi:hypothetical protein
LFFFVAKKPRSQLAGLPYNAAPARPRAQSARPLRLTLMPSMTDERDDLGIESAARWAFQLGYFLLADRRDACSVLYQATARMYVTTLVQKKRQAKRPKRDVHKKLSLTPGPLFQYLIYLCAEPYEHAQEQEHEASAARLTVEDMIVRYIKHLMLLYLEHNSFYATVGQSCILFDFGTSQAGRLYETLVQGSTAHLDTKGDYSVRDAKRELRRRLAIRFGRFVTIYDGTRKEQRFVATSDAGAHFRLVKRCLHRLQPVQEIGERAACWHLPVRFDLAAYDLAELQYDERNEDPRVEQAAELRRLHVVTHPCCWARLLRASCFNYSRRRLVLPEFILPTDENRDLRPPDDRRRPPVLTLAEMEGLKTLLRSEARRRKGLFASRLSVSVDDVPRGSWSIDREGAMQIRVDAGARVLALSARDEEGEVLLAQHLLQFGGASHDREEGPATITLEGGQEFTFTVSPAPSDTDAGFVVTIHFRETKLHKAVLSRLVRSYVLAADMLVGNWPHRAKAAAVIPICAALLCVLLIGWWAARTLRQDPQPSQVVLRDTDNPPVQPPKGPAVASSPPLDAPMGPKLGTKDRVGREGAQPDVRQRWPRSSDRGAAADNRSPLKVERRGVAGSPRLPEDALVLQDGGRLVKVDSRGRFTGLEALPAGWRRAVESALRARRVERPVVVEALGGQKETLLGDPGSASKFLIVGPAGTVVESEQPLFRWRALSGEASYVVAVFDSKFKRVAKSGPLTTTEWTCPRTLERGSTYTWQVTALRDGEAIVSPSPPAPEARFRVLEQAAADELIRARQLRPASHLTLGVLYARAGMADEAEREFRALVESNPGSAVARSLLLSVQAWRRAR